ncbi:transcription initiation factor IIB family protein [Haloarcula halophila]|uniref:hypothetical protein n=1 Tax=Haloarcula TaxID=2237 RepID=UPI0023E3D77F|nr:hypothetical protein [Halomicroarcula sp. DFY41]
MSSSPDDTVEGRLAQVGEQLQIPNNTLQITQVRLNQLSNEPDVDANSLDNVAAAALALSSREDGLPVSEHDIAKAWSELLESDGDIAISHQQLEAVGSYLDIDDVPPHPDALVQGFSEAVDMPEELVNVGHRILHDAFEADPTVVSGGPSPAATAGAVLSLAAIVNGEGENYDQDTLGQASGTNEVTVRNRAHELKDLLGEDRLQRDRYRVAPETDAADEAAATDTSGDEPDPTDSESDEQSTAADGAGTAEGGTEAAPEETGAEDDGAVADTEKYVETVTSMYPDELPTTTGVADAHEESEETVGDALEQLADNGTLQRKRAGSVVVWIPAEQDGVGTDLTVDAVETEVDALVEELEIGASTRLLARGMVSDAVDDVDVEDAAQLAGATVVAASRMEDGDIDAIEVAERREFPPRVLAQWLDTLDEAVDVEIPRREPGEIVDDLASELGISEEIREESRRSLERYDPTERGTGYTAAELGAGAVVFAATVNGTQLDIASLGEVSGADPNYITDAMNSIVVSLCLGLVRGDIDYADCAWTTDLLESELSPDIGDSYTGRVIALAKTYTAGREGRHIDDSTLDVVLGEE